MEKNIKKNVHICINESLCCTAETNKTSKSTIHQLNVNLFITAYEISKSLNVIKMFQFDFIAFSTGPCGV